MRKIFYPALLLLVPLAMTLAYACGDGGEAPSSHAESKDGVRHLTGYENPTANCTQCHGSDLKGGDGPSCYKCHGAVWESGS